MERGPRIFSLDEANEIVPTLELEFGRVARVRAELQPLVSSLGGSEAVQPILQGGAEGPKERMGDVARLKHLAQELAATVERINGHGCLVKDLDLGLVDFYGFRNNETVFLCWQFGEPAVSHWHPLDEGFRGRQPIEGMEILPPEFLN